MIDALDRPSIDVEAEQGLIGCVLFDNAAFRTLDGIEPRHFSEAFHVRLWDAMAARINDGKEAEPIQMAQHFAKDEAFLALGGMSYFGDLVDKAPANAAAPGIAAGIMAASLRRDLVALGAQIAAAGRQSPDPYDVVTEAERALAEIAQGASPGDANLVDARSSAEATLAEMEEEAERGLSKGKMTGLRCFDRRLGGLKPGHLIVVGGRPSMGKTSLARVAAYGAAGRNPHDLFAYFALEMDRRELNERTMADLSFHRGDGVAYQDMSRGKMDPMTLRNLREMLWQTPRNCLIDDTSGVTLDYIKRRVWALKRKGNLAAIFIDYLQIMTLPERNGRNDAALYGAITTGLKNLARAAGICVVLLSQLSRQVEQRDDKKPMLSDLRDSGSIEQDANAVLFPFREVYYLQRAEPKKTGPEHAAWEETVELLRRRMEVLCAKNRGGAIGSDQQDYFAEFDVVRDLVEGRS